ncbi:cation-dependent mannose-6-phosphate receptor [Sceloporus undulatus]|uniref:cation-dependent mannose-6-phosphate receptor n=1 Tax=Sceloporus undulatus TaxID=8520 RepID=UPI001C4BA970|nr:cation-dependent mannose-6-phosphate receptor [Sceloporus undulatus]XP_042304656.1 cation-dependent mannose-6-phosphate receptor [Sceloporus undulatus]
MFLAHSYLHAVLLALVTAVIAIENKCDLVGEKGNESPKELALLERLEPLTNMSFATDSVSEGENYTYTLKVCREVSATYPFSGLLQHNNKKGETKVVGRINETHVASGSKWIMLIYKGGDSYTSRCDQEKRKAIIMINCNRKTLASTFTMVTEERQKINECFYIFELESRLACPPEDSHLSVGSILLIIFASLIAVYITGGFLYQRLVVGAKGMEQFPHFAFWQDLGNLVADGCDFVCRSKPRNEPAAYRGVGDDQLGDESEERDDHLLPM